MRLSSVWVSHLCSCDDAGKAASVVVCVFCLPTSVLRVPVSRTWIGDWGLGIDVQKGRAHAGPTLLDCCSSHSTREAKACQDGHSIRSLLLNTVRDKRSVLWTVCSRSARNTVAGEHSQDLQVARQDPPGSRTQKCQAERRVKHIILARSCCSSRRCPSLFTVVAAA